MIAGDLGISTYLTCSNFVKVENPKTLERYLKHLSKLQRRLSKKKYGSKNYHVLSHQIVKLHAKIANARKDFLHKLSHALTANYQMIILEDLNVKGMIKNRKLARHIQVASWGMFKTFEEYKALWRGKTVIFVDRWFPSSKTCSHCRKTNKMPTLSDRVWVCPNCKTEHDRDQNVQRKPTFRRFKNGFAVKKLSTSVENATVCLSGNEACPKEECQTIFLRSNSDETGSTVVDRMRDQKIPLLIHGLMTLIK